MPKKSEREVKLFLIVPEEVEKYWPTVEKGLQEALEKSDDEFTLEHLKGMIQSRGLWMWVVMVGSEYGGVVVTEFLRTSKRFWLNIPFCYTVPSGSRESANAGLSVEGLAEVEKVARSFKCTGIKFLSSRRGFAKVAEKTGFEERFVEYVKRF